MSTLQDVANKYQGNHPAQKKFAEAAQSLSALKNLIKGLSKDEQNNLLEMIAEQKTLSVEVAEYLCQFDNEPIRSNVAQNPNTPIEVLTQLAQDEDPYIRQHVAQHPNTSVEILMQLAQDKDRDVRICVVRNPSTSVEILMRLIHNADQYVRMIAQEKLVKQRTKENKVYEHVLRRLRSLI